MADDALSEPEGAAPTGLRGRVKRLVEDERFTRAIMIVIIVNAVTLGLETSDTVMGAVGGGLLTLDKIALGIFVVEILLKLFAYRWRFFRNGWNVFDFIIVGIALMPSSGALSVLRSLRILRALRLFSTVPAMRKVVQALLSALPGMGAIVGVLAVLFYIGAVVATKLFKETFPEWFGTIGESAYTLFQVMTLESWSMGIVRPVMEQHPQAWLFFVPFIVVTSFAILNLFIGVIVNALQELQDAERAKERGETEEIAHAEGERVLAAVESLRTEMAALRRTIEKR